MRLPELPELLSLAGARYEAEEVYPPAEAVFRAYELCPPAAVKVVIVGQDPYHEPGQANGLAFSVPVGVTLPPSLRNILREVANEYPEAAATPTSGDLTPWARQGVLLLNTTLTVLRGQAGAHRHLGWQRLTQATLTALAARGGVAFLLWGNDARAFVNVIAEHSNAQAPNLVLEAAHPSPLSARRGFFGCNHFRQVNEWLARQGRQAIDWHSL